jgi:hypothetical protein
MAHDEIIEAEFEEITPERVDESRALVTIAAPKAEPRASGLPFSFRSDASFVAQLIAAAANAPQTRTLRRASPEDALASYRGTLSRDRVTAPTGKTTSRTV